MYELTHNFRNMMPEMDAGEEKRFQHATERKKYN